MAERCRNARRVRRRRMTLSAIALVSLSHAASALQFDADGELPGQVAAAADVALSRDTSSSLPPNTLTTQCGLLCTSVTNTMACVGLQDTSLATCKRTKQMKGVSCQPNDQSSSSILCLWPEPSQWRIQLTTNAELLALAREDVQLDDSGEMAMAIVLNASDVQQISGFALPGYVTQLRLRAADPTEQLSLRISSEMLATWPSLELLSIRNLDLADVTSIPSFPKLRTLDLVAARITEWTKPTTPALSVLDLSANDLAVIPEGSLPPSLNVLNVSSNRLVELPTDIASLAGLFRLSVSRNNLAKLTEFPKLPALKELYLSSAQLVTVPSGVANLPALQILDLSHNDLSAPTSAAFPATLNQLHLRNCSLKTLPGDFGIEKTWELVDLSENPFDEGTFAGVNLRANNLILEKVQLTAVLPNIKTWAVANTLSLSKNALGAVSGTDLPSDIVELRLADCFLKEVPPELSALRRLSILDLSNNTLGPVPTGSLPTSLTKLFLGGCGLSLVPPDVAAMSDSLETLDLGGNKLENVQLKGFSRLRRLNLQGNALTTFPTDVFAMPNLTHLDLRGNPLSKLTFTADQRDFLASRLRVLEIDASAFAVDEGTCASSVLLRGKYTVCTQQSSSSPSSSSRPPVPSTPSTNPEPASTTTSSVSTRLLNYIFVGAVGVVMLVSIFVARLPPPKRRTSYSGTNGGMGGGGGGGGGAPILLDGDSYGSLVSATHRYGPMDMWEDPELLKWRIDILDIELVMQITQGGHSVVWLARCQHETVVVKRLHPKRAHDARSFERFVDEIKSLGRLSHENIIEFLGISWTCDADLQLVVEFMSNGDLERMLRLTQNDSDANTWNARKVRIALDVAEALVFLHGLDPALCHCDLKSRHVLLDDKFTAKLADFSMCYSKRPRHTMDGISGASSRSSRSIAPEALSGRRAAHGQAVDMYAFGVILAELDSHELPFSDITLSNGEPLSDVAMLELLSMGALQPSITPACPSVVAFLIADCLSFDPRRRPTAQDAVQRLEGVLESYLGLSVVSEDRHVEGGGEEEEEEKKEEHVILADSPVRMTGRSALDSHEEPTRFNVSLGSDGMYQI